MINLEQKGRWIYLRPFPEPKLLKLLNDEFSYKKKGGEFMPNPQWAIVKMYQKGHGRLPIGLLHKLERLLKNNDVKYTKLTTGSSLMNLNRKDDGLYNFQQSALKMALLRRGGILQIPTGGGKTRTAISFINTLNVPTLVIVPTLDLKSQWEKQVPENVHVRTYQGLKSKKYIQQFGLIIFDECHISSCNTIQKIAMNLNEEAVTLGLSATPFMRDDDNLKVEGVIGPVIYKISLRDLITEGYLVDALVHYHHLKWMDGEYMDYPDVVRNYVDENLERNGKIINLTCDSIGHVLILVNHIKHGNFLYEELDELGEDVIFLNGNSKKRNEKMNHRIIIATSIFDVGIDIPRLKTLIFGGGGKSTIQTTQRLGRVLRTYPGKETAMVHDFKDNVKYLKDHYLKRRKILSENFEIIDIE